MSTGTKIEWTERTWNPVTGCTKVSPGCDHCYAEKITERFHGEGSFAEVKLHEDRLTAPLRRRKPTRWFVNSMSDLFHQDVPDEFIARVFAVMAATPQHTYQILTKRHSRMRALLSSSDFVDAVLEIVHVWLGLGETEVDRVVAQWRWPLPNVWLGVSVEDQKRAELRIPSLLDTPAAVRFLSCEPLLGPVDLDQPRCDAHDRREVTVDDNGQEWCGYCADDGFSGELSYGHWLNPFDGGISWVIVGGESGPGARPMDPAWAESLVVQCQAADISAFVKQMGSAWGSHHHDIGTFPKALRVRAFPEVITNA